MKILTALSVSIIVCLFIGAISIGKDMRLQAATKKAVKIAEAKPKCGLDGKKLSMTKVKIRRF